MVKRDKFDEEQKVEALLAAFGRELGESRADFCEALMDPDREDPSMFLDIEDWDPILAEKTFGKKKRKVRRALLLAAVLVLTMALAVVAVEGVKLKQNTMHMKETAGESTRLTDIDKTKFAVEDFNVTYVPEGYELVEDQAFGDMMRKIGYFNEAGDGVWVKISKTENFGANVDNQRSERVEVLINDKQGFVFISEHTNTIVWQMGDCTIDISAKISQEELVEIASHIFVD